MLASPQRKPKQKPATDSGVGPCDPPHWWHLWPAPPGGPNPLQIDLVVVVGEGISKDSELSEVGGSLRGHRREGVCNGITKTY